ncbi:MAG: hypothetical protein JXN64_05640 [Spirochaetes bacterium]|nr:hypothetical protein [Spirochaetota bacterium]
MKRMLKFFFVFLAVFLLNITGAFAQETEKENGDMEKVVQESEKTAQDAEKPDKPKRVVNTFFGGMGKDIYISGYGAFTGSYARIKHKDAFLPGFRAGVILDNFVVGFSGAGLAYPNERKDFGDKSYTDNKDYVNFGYGGGMIEYYFFPKKLVHFSIGTTIGGGGLNFSSDDDDDDDDHRGADKFFVVEPEVNIFVNLARFCRIGIGGSYRYINGLDNDVYKDKHFSGANVKVIAAFGWF